ncbi:TIGR00730 family Rossman fold protein [Paraflavisolibacter sp. H34]|uniref:LOG family protein n=1 Tax=Huijunlia imazamoxiresistens TaxID=3127457 RepID=UPI0030174495
MATIQSLAIFCGSKFGKHEVYCQHARELGRLLAEKGVTLIFGGGKNGLMGCAANSSMESGGTVRGVIPALLQEREHQHDAITELLVVEDMHQRKRKLYEFCDAAIILPGGFGTLDELFEILTWNGLAIHDKKVFLLNSGGFYRHLLEHLQFLEDEGFLYGRLHEQLTVLQEPADLLPFLQD